MNSVANHQNEAALHAIDYWQVIKNRYGIILLTLLLVFITAAVITYVMPKKYESIAVIEVKPPTPGMSPLGSSSPPNLRRSKAAIRWRKLSMAYSSLTAGTWTRKPPSTY
jgi:uncharacterized protein involved in exopolysaccharide biosynthesis